MIAGYIARVLAENVAGLVAEGVPDRGPASILPDRALDLVSRGRGAPEKAVGGAFRHDVPLVSPPPLTTHQPLSATQAPCGTSRGVSRNGQLSELGLVDDRRRNFAEPGVRI